MSQTHVFCLSGVASYDQAPRGTRISNLLQVPEELRIMRRSLTAAGLTEIHPFDGPERSHVALAAALDEPYESAERLVIYCTGHGSFFGNRYRLLESGRGHRTDPADLIAPLEKWDNLTEVVLIIDACGAESGVDAALSEMRIRGTHTSTIGLWAMGSSRRLESSQQTTFAKAFEDVLVATSQPSWTSRFIDLVQLSENVNSALDDAQTVWLSDARPATPSTALPNAGFQDPVAPTGLPLPVARWAASARGVADASLPGRFFIGRTIELAALPQRLFEAAPRPVVLTGPPCVGVSALAGAFVLRQQGAGPVGTIAVRGNPQQIRQRLTRSMGGRGDDDLDALLRRASPLNVVMDFLDESADPDDWEGLFTQLSGVRGVRLCIAMAIDSTIPVPDHVAIHLDDLPVGSVHAYLFQQVRLALPVGSPDSCATVTDALVQRCGGDIAVATAVTRVSGPSRVYASAEDYLTSALQAVDAEALEVARRRAATVVAPQIAAAIATGLAAVARIDPDARLNARDWAQIASRPDHKVDAQEIPRAAEAMRSLVNIERGDDGIVRYRTPFRLATATRLDPMTLLGGLTQLARPAEADWTSMDRGVSSLIGHVAARGLGPQPLLDDPRFLLDAPPSVVSKALQDSTFGKQEIARRSRMWRLVPPVGPLEDRAMLLRIGAGRYRVSPLTCAVHPAASMASAVDWVQADCEPPFRIVRMAATTDGREVAVSLRADDSIAFHDVGTDDITRPMVELPGTPDDVAVATIDGRPTALVSTWQGDVFVIDCTADDAPGPIPGLRVSLSLTDARPGHVALHSSGHAVLARGRQAWSWNVIDETEPAPLASLDSDVVEVRLAGDDSSPIAWIVSTSGRIRQLLLEGPTTRAPAPFPLPHRPWRAAVSRSGANLVFADANGSLHFRGSAAASLDVSPRLAEVRSLAISDSHFAVGGSIQGRSGWLVVQSLVDAAATTTIAVDEAVLDLHLTDGALVVARPAGLMRMHLPTTDAEEYTGV